MLLIHRKTRSYILRKVVFIFTGEVCKAVKNLELDYVIVQPGPEIPQLLFSKWLFDAESDF